MKAVILAGGFGTRLSEETDMRPKPMIEIGGHPILWHIMKCYGAAGVTDFVICAGYKASVIKRYFVDYFLENSDVEVDTSSGDVKYLSTVAEPWRVKVIDTGLHTMTGGRLKRIKDHLGPESFCMTYGDGVADIDIRALVEHHKTHGKLATVTAVRAPGRFGILSLKANDQVSRFYEKPADEVGWINGGYFVLKPEALDHVVDDTTIWERKPLEQLALDGQLSARRHDGFWRPMDTLRDKRDLEALWAEKNPPWKSW
jgi:glucose-1-phosphate cytidylyltransferase